MARRLYLVRHGRAAASFAEAHDPGLDPLGMSQAEAMAARLVSLGPLGLVASPMRRTRETVAPLERLWGRSSRIEPAVSEIPSPDIGLVQRSEWLGGVMAGRWSAVGSELEAWRRAVVAALAAIREPSVVVTHYVVINAAVGAAVGDDRVTIFAPDHCSITVIDVADGTLQLIERGAESATPVL